MAVWLKSGKHELGVADGVVRKADFAALIEACDLHAQAARLLAEASEEAIIIVSAATERARVTLDQAQQRGKEIQQEAYDIGWSEAAARWVEEMATKAFDARQSVQRASDRLAELVVMATQRVIEVEDKQGLYRRALRSVRQLARDSKTLVLHIGAEDAGHARQVVGEIAAEVGIEVPLEVRVDEKLQAGGCVLESDYGLIDASLGLQLETVKQAISKAARAALIQADGLDAPDQPAPAHDHA